MESNVTIQPLTPSNYHVWKMKVIIVLKNKGLYRVIMETKKEPTTTKHKEKSFNKCDQAFGFLCLNLSFELLFHVENKKTSNQVWEALDKLFGEIDELRIHELENQLLGLSLRSFSTLQYFFSKFKSLKLQLKDCGIDKKED